MKAVVVISIASLLAGCASQPPITAPPLPVAAAAKVSSCTRGAIDSARVFIVCPLRAATPDDAQLALQGPADLSLDIVSLAEEYGVARQAVQGIEPATYARIVTKTPEVPSRKVSSAKSGTIDIKGRSFHKVKLDNGAEKPVVVYLEQ